MNTRALATKSILDILNKKYSLLTLSNKLSNKQISTQDKSFIKLLCYEFFRNYYSLEKILDKYVKNNTKHKVKILLMLGILQLLEINQPKYASINETVNACKNLKLLWAKKLVNGVLRNILRNIEDIKQEFLNYKNFDLPQWLINLLKKQYSTNYKEIIKNFNTKADMFIRLNQSKNIIEITDYLKNENIEYTDLGPENCLKLSNPIEVNNNHFFKDGYFSVQDISAQYAGGIINPQDNDNILDACAAPGGKTTHLIELNTKANITAIDILDRRLELLKENLNRVNPQNNVSILKHDLTQSLQGKFNKIILDAPCSALGTIKRNPDIKLLRQPEDIDNIKVLQQQILQNLWDNNLTKNGYLLYITCSILQQENQHQIEKFLATNDNAQIIKIDELTKYKTNMGYQILPSENQGDGFYYCLLQKKPTAKSLI